MTSQLTNLFKKLSLTDRKMLIRTIKDDYAISDDCYKCGFEIKWEHNLVCPRCKGD